VPPGKRSAKSSAGNISASGIITATKKVASDFFQLKTQVAENSSCQGQELTNAIGLNSADNNNLLRCNGSTWVSMLQKGTDGTNGTNSTSSATPTASYLDNTITSESKNFTFTGESESGNTKWNCSEWTKPGFSTFSAVKQANENQVHIEIACTNNSWHVAIVRNDTDLGNITVDVTSIKKNNGYGIIVNDDNYFEIDVPSSSSKILKYPPYTTKIYPWYLTNKLNFSWTAERTGLVAETNQWDIKTEHPKHKGNNWGSVGWSTLSFKGPVKVDYSWVVYTNTTTWDHHDTNLSCTNWTRPVINGFKSQNGRLNFDEFSSWCYNGFWYVKGRNSQQINIVSGWVSYKINHKLP
jgi:hypothetical protein